MSLDTVFVSTWEAPCGIASYTASLTDALRGCQVPVTILAEARDRPEPFLDARAFPVWKRGYEYASLNGLGAVERAITAASAAPRLVHIQHEFGLFPQTKDLARLTTRLTTHGVRVVITLHTVLPRPQMCDLRTWLAKGFDGEIIVHSAEAAAALEIDSPRVRVIPHGIRAVAALDPEECRRSLKLPLDRVIALCPGFISESKGHAEIIEAVASCSRDVLCVIVGDCRDERYREKLEVGIRNFDAANRVHVHYGYKTTAEMDRYFAAADFVVLGATEQDAPPYSASGQLADAVAHRKAVIAKNVPSYRGSHALHYQTPVECGRLIAYLARRPQFDALTTLELGLTRHWQTIAQQHLKIYGL